MEIKLKKIHEKILKDLKLFSAKEVKEGIKEIEKKIGCLLASDIFSYYILQGKEVIFRTIIDIEKEGQLLGGLRMGDWIKCSDRLPEEGQYVWLCSKDKRVFKEIWQEESFDITGEMGKEFMVAWWQPFIEPEPPKEEGKE